MILAVKILLGLIFLSGNNHVIDNYLKQHLNNYKKFEYKIISEKENSIENFVPDETREFKLQGKYAYIPVNYELSNGTKSQGIITLKIKVFKNVLVAARKIFKGEELSRADFNVEEKEISSLRVDPINSVDNISKFRARLNITPETVIGENMIELIPDVKIGDKVRAIYSKGIVNISFDATARTNGVIGEVIKIKNDDKKIFKAKVLSYNTVKIVE